MKTKSITTIVAALAAAFITTTAFAHEGEDHAKGKAAAAKKDDHSAHAGIPKDYPLKQCPVSDDGFDHGKPIKVTHAGTDVYLCCKSCKKDFDKEPAKYVKMVKDAATKKK